MGTVYDVAQTSVMTTIAWVMGREFFNDLTDSQQSAIDRGVELLEKTLTIGR